MSMSGVLLFSTFPRAGAYIPLLPRWLQDGAGSGAGRSGGGLAYKISCSSPLAVYHKPKLLFFFSLRTGT